MSSAAASRKVALLTGGAGFLGFHLTNKLLSEGYFVISVDNLCTGHMNNVNAFRSDPNYFFLQHDVSLPIPRDAHELLNQVCEIYNMACPASPPHYQRDPIATVKTAFLGVLHLLEFARERDALFLQASTSEVYGDPHVHPQPETYWGHVSCTGIRACYDEGKRVGETLCFEFNRQHGTRVRVVRIFNTYGPNMHPFDGRVVSNFIRQALANENITIYGTGSQTRSFQYCSDLVDGIWRMVHNDSGFIGPVNLGNPNEFTVRELAQMVLELIPTSTSQIIFLPCPTDDPTQRKPDITVAREKLGWAPCVQIKEGLSSTIKYFASIDLADYDDHLKPLIMAIEKK